MESQAAIQSEDRSDVITRQVVNMGIPLRGTGCTPRVRSKAEAEGKRGDCPLCLPDCRKFFWRKCVPLSEAKKGAKRNASRLTKIKGGLF